MSHEPDPAARAVVRTPATARTPVPPPPPPMRRPHVRLRLVRLLALVVAVTGALALIAPERSAAQSTTTIWSATLTVDHTAVGAGCDNTDPQQDDCSNALTDDDFTFGGVTYTFEYLLQYDEDNQVAVKFDTGSASAHKTALASLTLNLPGAALAIEDATVSSSLNDLVWDYDLDPDWADGDEIAVSLTQPAASTPSTPTTSNPTSTSSTGGRPLSVDAASIAGWSIDEGTAKKKVGVIRSTAASIPKTRWTFTVNTLVTQFSSGMSVLTPATDYFTVAANGRVSYTGANPRAGRTPTGMGTAHLTITISDSKNKAGDLRLTIPIAMKAQPTLTAIESSTANCTIIETIADKNVCKIKVAEIGDKRTKFVLESAGSEFYGTITGIFTIDEATGRLSYDGSAVVGQSFRAIAKYPHKIDIDIAVTDKKNKFAELELTIDIAVRQVQPPRLVAIGAPYNGWTVKAGEADDNIGTVYGAALDGDIVKIERRAKLRYEIIQAVDLDNAGDERGRALLIGKNAAFTIQKGTGQVSYTGERIEGEVVKITIRVSDKKNLAPPIEIVSYVQVDPQPLLTYNEANPPPAVWRGAVHDGCPAKPGYVNLGNSPIIDLQQPSPAPLLDPAERYVTVPAPCDYVTEEAHREWCAEPSRWTKDACRGWSPPFLSGS